MSRHVWTPDEIEVLRRAYVLFGTQWVAERLGLKPEQVRNKARKLDLDGRRPAHGHVLVAEAAFHAGVSVNTVLARARAAGVLRCVGRRSDGKPRFSTVPCKWAEELAADYGRRVAARERGWVRLEDAARATGIDEDTIRRGIRGASPLMASLGVKIRWALARSEGGGRSGVVLHPHDVEALRVALDRRSRLARSLVRVKALAVECGVSPMGGLARVFARLGVAPVVIHLPRGRASFVTPAEADMVRREYGLRVAA